MDEWREGGMDGLTEGKKDELTHRLWMVGWMDGRTKQINRWNLSKLRFRKQTEITNIFSCSIFFPTLIQTKFQKPTNQIPHIFSVFQALPGTCLSEKGKVKRRRVWSQILQKVIYLPLSWATTRSCRNIVWVKSWIHHENIRRTTTIEFMQEVTIMLQHLVCSQGYFWFLMKL